MGKLIPSVHVSSAKMQHAEVSGMVTVGEDHARLLSEKLGREVEVGEQFDLGVLAIYDKSMRKRFVGNFRASIRALNSPFAKPLVKE